MISTNTPNYKIKDYLFFENQDIEKISIKEGIKIIGERSFYKSKKLKKIILPDSLEKIEASAFSGCENLEEIILPRNLKHIDYRAFADCKRLKRIVIPDNVESIDWGAFSGCENLEEVILPKNLKKLSDQLFLNCKKLKYVELPKVLTELPDECFKGCHSLDIKLSPNIKTLGKSTFENCYKLSTFPKHVTKYDINTFKNCRSLTSATINKDITKRRYIHELPDGLFDGCVNLSTIEYSNTNKISIGKRCFRNCKSLKEIPNFINNYNERAFENCNSLTHINLISKKIPFACFRNCKNIKKVTNQNIIEEIESFAFSGCENIEEFSLTNVLNVPSEVFSNCKKLKKVKLNKNTKRIETKAFENCYELNDIVLPDTVEVIKKFAFANCINLEKFRIPKMLTTLDSSAFAFNTSLKKIENNPENNFYQALDNKILFDNRNQKIILYAGGLNEEKLSLEPFTVIDNQDRETIFPINSIAKFAFSTAPNLKELAICSSVSEIDTKAFIGANNLEKLEIIIVTFFTSVNLQTTSNNKIIVNEKDISQFPFKTLKFSLSSNNKDNKNPVFLMISNFNPNFKNLKRIEFSNDCSYVISNNCFENCNQVKSVKIPINILSIGTNAFSKNTKVIFDNGMVLTNLLHMGKDKNYFGDYIRYDIDDNETYYIENNGEIIKLTKNDIERLCKNSDLIKESPIKFVDFLKCLKKFDLEIPLLLNGVLIKNISLKNKITLFNTLRKDDNFYLNVLEKSKLFDKDDTITQSILEDENFEKVVDYINIFKNYNIKEELLYNKILFNSYKAKDLEELIILDYPLLLKTLTESELLETKETDEISKKILLKNTLKDFIVNIKNSNIKDKYIFNKTFIACAKNPLFKELLDVYDANTKRLLKRSKTITNNKVSVDNFNDLLTLMKITGALEKDPITRQRAATFITEKLFSETLNNKDKNINKIIGDDIHRVFNFEPEFGYNSEFADFFLNNYQAIIAEEKNKSGFIQRVYKNFNEISKTSTSNKGRQRKLKVTLEKCKSYLQAHKFGKVDPQHAELAKLIGAWYDNKKTFDKAVKLEKEIENAPRNIFTKSFIDENNRIIYDNDPKNDLKENLNENYSYQWLPKQDIDNFVLGKYCNCCAHIEGAGQGIMRASMALNCCQNLVIRNEEGTIIAKATIYVNKEQNYAVYNNIEVSLKYKNENDLKKIYDALIRGTNAFLETYNLNNPKEQIREITVGLNRNALSEYLTDEKHPKTKTYQALYFGRYSIENNYHYNGDWESGQRLILKK